MATKRMPLPRKTVENRRSSTTPIWSLITPMNQRKAMPANGTRFSPACSRRRRPGSATMIAGRGPGQRRTDDDEPDHEQQREDDPGHRGGPAGAPPPCGQRRPGRRSRHAGSEGIRHGSSPVLGSVSAQSAARGGHRTFTARATTSATRVREIAASAMVHNFDQCRIGETSAAPNAVEMLNERVR